MSPHNGVGGVSNLRAMFETKTSEDHPASPPSRGRSPALSDASLHSRPVSKVRASFVAVERSGDTEDVQQWGLRKVSDVTKMANVKDGLHNGSLPNGASNTPGKNSLSNGIGGDSVSSVENAVPREAPDDGLGGILKGSAFEASPKPAAPRPHAAEADKASAAATPSQLHTAAAMPNARPSPETHSKLPSQSIASRIKDAVASGHNEPPRSVNLNAKPGAIPIKPPPTRQVPPQKRSTASPASPKTPRTPRTPRTPAALGASASPTTQKSLGRGSASEPAAVADSTKDAASPEQTTTSPTLPKETKRTSMSKPAVPRARQSVISSTRTNGVKKDAKPKSPDTNSNSKADRMPNTAAANAATAPTAASNARNQSSTAPVRRPTVTKRDRPSTKPPAPTAPATKRLSRASLSSQPGQSDATRSRTSGAKRAPDDGFLARMMRPTASSAQKAHEKVATSSPPQARKTAAKPTSKGHARRSVALSDEDKENSHQGGEVDHGMAPTAEPRQFERNRDAGAEGQPLTDITPAPESPSGHSEAGPEPEVVEGSNS